MFLGLFHVFWEIVLRNFPFYKVDDDMVSLRIYSFDGIVSQWGASVRMVVAQIVAPVQLAAMFLLKRLQHEGAGGCLVVQ